MGSLVVVVPTKRVKLKLEFGNRARWSLLAQKALDGLMETFDLAAGLRMVGGGVFEDDAEALELEFQKDLAASGLGGEDGSIVAEQGSWKPNSLEAE